MLCYNDNFQFGTYYLNKCLPSVAYVLNKYLPSVAYVNYKLTCSNFSFVYRAGQSNLVAAVRASRKRRGVPEQQEDEDLLNLNAECDEETEAGADFTLPGSHVQTASGRIWTPRGPNSIPPAPPSHAAKTILIPSGDRNWRERPFNKKARVPNTILGALIRHHYPQIVLDTSLVPPSYEAASKWRHWYMRGPDADPSAELCAEKARYKWPDEQTELKDKWMKTLERCCEKLARNQIYNARIYAVVAYYA